MAVPQNAAAARRVHGDSARALIVEDEADIAEIIRYHLEGQRLEVRTCRRGDDVMRMANEFRPDVILLDLMLPVVNGWEVCRRLKSDAETANIAIIMVSGRVDLPPRNWTISGLRN